MQKWTCPAHGQINAKRESPGKSPSHHYAATAPFRQGGLWILVKTYKLRLPLDKGAFHYKYVTPATDSDTALLKVTQSSCLISSSTKGASFFFTTHSTILVSLPE